MSAKLGYDVWDADNHLYEAVDAYTRYLPKRYEGAIRFVDVNGRDKLEILGKVSETIPNPTYVVIPTPGAWTEYFRGNNPEGKSLRELAQPIRCPEEFRRPDLRLRLMDEQGIDGCVVFPTTAGLLEEHMKADVELTHAVVHAYNQWLLDDWTFNYEGRIIPTPVVTLPDVAQAVAELEWCLDHGAKTVLIRPAPVPQPDGSSLSPALADFDPFWRLCEDAGISVMMHNADSGYDRYATDWEPGRDEFQGFNQTLFRVVPLRGEPPHLRHPRRVRRPRTLPTVPAAARRRRRERRRVGAPPPRLLRPRLQEDAGPVRRAPERHAAPPRVDQPVPRGRHALPRRRARRRPRAVRLRLPAPRRARRSARVRRRARRPARSRSSSR